MTRMLGACHQWRKCTCWDCYARWASQVPRKRAQRARERRQWKADISVR